MNKKVLSVIMFTVGAAIGSAVTWKVLKTKYEQIAQDEIDSVKEEYLSLMQKMKKKLQDDVVNAKTQENDISEVEDDDYCDDASRDFTEQDMVEYHKLAGSYHKTDDIKENNKKGEDTEEVEVAYINGPYVISPDDFACSPPGFNAQPLDYFADGVLADGWGYEVNIEETIGEDALNHFGEYDDDIVYVRNERTEIDYEVSRDPRTYEEAVLKKSDSY